MSVRVVVDCMLALVVVEGMPAAVLVDMCIGDPLKSMLW
jgi:hypothetical protein